jgi:hypothetical protein
MFTFLDNSTSRAQTADSNPAWFTDRQNSQKRFSDIHPRDFLLVVAKRLKTENESESSRIKAQECISMCRRHRGMTPNDLFGFWNNGVWCEHPAFANLHGTNIFQSLIRGAEANFAQIDIRLDIKAKANTRENRAVEKICRAVYENSKNELWSKSKKQDSFYAKILKLNAFFISRFDKEKGEYSIPIPEYNDLAYEEGGMYVCTECYNSGDYSAQSDRNFSSSCESCGSDALFVLDDPQTVTDEIVGGFSQKRSGCAETIVADGIDVSGGGERAKPGDIESLDWLEWRYFAQKAELQRLYPHLQLLGKPEWSYQTRLKVALRRFEAGEATPTTDYDKTNYEVRQIWLDKTEYEGEGAAKDVFKLGETVILEKGETFAEKYPDGLVFAVIGNEIAFVDGENKNKRVKSSIWLSDGISFNGLGAKSGLLIQKKINFLDNMAMEGEARSLKGSMLYRPEAIDGASLEGANTNIPLKVDSDNIPMQEAAMPLKVSGLSAESMMYLDSQVATMQKIMGVPDVSLGEDTSTDKTYGGQMLRAKSASTLLLPASLSEARAMEGTMMDILDIIQTYYAPEALRQFGLTFGAEFLDDEIEAFFNADLKKAITCSYAQGSEIPESRADKQMRIRNDVAAGFVLMTGELQSQFLKESAYDGIDLNNYESNLNLAEKRFNFIKEMIEPMKEEIEGLFEYYEQLLIDPATGARATDEIGSPVVNPIIRQYLDLPQLQPYLQVENHEQMVEFWADRVRELAASTHDQSSVIIGICEAMVSRHNQMIFESALKQQTLMGLTQMPSQVGQQMLSTAATPSDGKDDEGANKTPQTKGGSGARRRGGGAPTANK